MSSSSSASPSFSTPKTPWFEYDVHQNYPLAFYFVDPLSRLPEHQPRSQSSNSQSHSQSHSRSYSSSGRVHDEFKHDSEQTLRMANACKRAEHERIKSALKAGKTIDPHHISACGVEASVQAMYTLELEQVSAQQKQQHQQQK